jgi:hypothetical protein
MIVKISKLFEETKTSSGGKEYEVFTIEGTKKGFDGAPDEKWTKSLMPWKHAEFIETLRSIGVGGQALIKSRKEGKFWEIDSVEQYAAGKPGGSKPKPSAGGDKPAGGSPAPAESSSRQVSVVYTPPVSTDSKYIGMLKVAGDLVMKMMEQSPNFDKLIKKSATPELVKQMVIDLANDFYKNDPSGSTEADGSGVIPPSPEDGPAPDGGAPTEDDIPF